MKHLSLSLFFLFAFLILSGCENERFRPLEEYEFETVTWQLFSISTWDDTGGVGTTLLDSERTLQFWNGTVRSNGSFCELDGVVGPIEERPYNPIYQEITDESCTENEEVSYWRYEIDNDAGELRIIFNYFLVGWIYSYEIVQE